MHFLARTADPGLKEYHCSTFFARKADPEQGGTRCFTFCAHAADPDRHRNHSSTLHMLLTLTDTETIAPPSWHMQLTLTDMKTIAPPSWHMLLTLAETNTIALPYLHMQLTQDRESRAKRGWQAPLPGGGGGAVMAAPSQPPGGYGTGSWSGYASLKLTSSPLQGAEATASPPRTITGEQCCHCPPLLVCGTRQSVASYCFCWHEPVEEGTLAQCSLLNRLMPAEAVTCQSYALSVLQFRMASNPASVWRYRGMTSSLKSTAAQDCMVPSAWWAASLFAYNRLLPPQLQHLSRAAAPISFCSHDTEVLEWASSYELLSAPT